ncbi:M23 family metallopeptidase [Aneurinibacillus aneurinilyticus]|jgi:stage II sporulation protein Q|uniref:M23 family metallopeptidase n=2 Tax=Aneurinibacillus aneurinilyticus TaxID=1391 RepID=A0A848CVB3_ANEAE|nr:M23 family metallopeptidase [Aneurinibacillus aneurinilyticus]ERI07065.1 stage II sporulation protein Q family protein [Aneurinibacillus aneurinilyticus ATCC 12856]MCI1694679.1 M23 family metallopeptidase [Aneurinibacillus aneurinilyticus]MED0706398.1 M23 family metallopeptidase [Aneurinibacillus aneurinilyticus]MED0723672.1 M23 family metallopeptidase [Aneurinibacillus aneurinilyticus]MED0730646.1 M23 family metallopeptidase [Aneurinibacillus aneurinilyticus]
MDEQKKSTTSSSPVQKVKRGGWRRIMGKKWIFPAMYLGAAAIILAGVMWYQNSKDFTTKLATPQAAPSKPSAPTQVAQGGNEQQPAVPVNADDGKLAWPTKSEATEKVMGYFDDASDKKDQEAALVQFDNSYWPNTGIAIAAKDKKSFEVTAAAAGKVVKSERDPMLGYQVEIEHKDGLSTVYASLEDTKVNVGDTVDRGAVLGMAGRNVFEKDFGIHLHFEVHKNGEAVAPEQYLKKTDNMTQAK